MRWIFRVIRFVLFVVVALLVFGFVVRGLWNWLMPSLFGLHLIRFSQAVGLIILGRILFGGFRGRPGAGMHWRRRMSERWEQMTPEEREKFREGVRGRCGWRSAPVQTKPEAKPGGEA
jgi:hypothetical protein